MASVYASYDRIYDAIKKHAAKWNILVLQIGSNDFTQEAPQKFVRSLLVFLEYVTLCVWQQHEINILYRKHTHEYPMQMDIGTPTPVGAANLQLKAVCENSSYIDFWQHRSLWHVRSISQDGVHQAAEVMPR